MSANISTDELAWRRVESSARRISDLEAENKRLREALAVIEATTTPDTPWHKVAAAALR